MDRPPETPDTEPVVVTGGERPVVRSILEQQLDIFTRTLQGANEALSFSISALAVLEGETDHAGWDPRNHSGVGQQVAGGPGERE